MFMPITSTDPLAAASAPAGADAATAASEASIGGTTLSTLVLWLAVTLLGTGLLVFAFRWVFSHAKDGPGETSEDKSVVRGWLAILLVSGLLLFCAVSFFVADAAPRNLLIGGIVASAGTVTAFYFASKSNEQTQQNFLNAAFGNTAVDFPKLEGMTVAQAQGVLNNLRLSGVTDPPDAGANATVATTVPTAGTRVKAGDVVRLAVR
jgi:hypothetical protein